MPNSLWENPEFDPEASLETIKPLPLEEKRDRVESYREKLLQQLDGIVRAQQEMRFQISEDPDTHFSDLMDAWEEETASLGLSPWQQELAEKFIDRFATRRTAINEVRELYPDDKQLFKYMFGREPVGEVEVETGPITIYFKCKNPDDYLSIYYSHNHEFNDHMRMVANMSAGVSITTAPVASLEGAIIAENGNHDPVTSAKIRAHEEQHAYRRLFDPVSTGRTRYEMLEHKTPQERQAMLETICRQRRRYSEHAMSDEVLAYMKEGMSKSEIIRILTTKQDGVSLYDYFKDDIRRIRAFYMYPETEPAIKKVFEDEYIQMVGDAIDAVDTVKEMGLSMGEAIDFFTMLPASHWKKWSRRLSGYLASERPLSSLKRTDDIILEKYDGLATEFDAIPYNRPKKARKKRS